jgi:hypothetical protein
VTKLQLTLVPTLWTFCLRQMSRLTPVLKSVLSLLLHPLLPLVLSPPLSLALKVSLHLFLSLPLSRSLRLTLGLSLRVFLSPTARLFLLLALPSKLRSLLSSPTWRSSPLPILQPLKLSLHSLHRS